ncbi:sugar phosphate isomerase/epimerase family protein [Lentiprolixibacter aurantiacus]|uniref:Sugar phosphate isomerase/epimerase n=1 Tax=Lentiprolixibacter aurantiacus TaxID=2993939 RepID=A0AAE3MNT3_9FLAO|nr:sugar phosphate isomerase/epimerase [Lentiprolixibacter aurantiacus]MCX2720262.1 sugar phosphate isomerase/epimerase [Lentiprolixibacter aurantiacus]
MDRKTFLKNSGLFVAGSLLAPELAIGRGFPSSKRLKSVGLQLFSIPLPLEQDFEGTVAMISGMGFRELELYGPYPFSAQSNKTRWAGITPMLGFSGSGFFGLSQSRFKAVLDANRLRVPAMHTDLDTLENHLEKLAESANYLGAKYVILPAIPEERRQNLDGYKAVADSFNTIGRRARELGIRFAYHNHGYGLSEMEGEIPFELLMERTDPNAVFLEMDLFWTIAGRADPIAYLKKYKNRYRLMHVKDMAQLKHFEGDGGDAAQWIALFPNMTSAGSGVLSLPEILSVARKNGVKHFFVEQDMAKKPEVVLKKSLDYLLALDV